MTDPRTRHTADVYSALAEQFDRERAPALGARAARILTRLDLPSAHLVLDVGTGSGGLLEAIRARAPGAHIVGVDPAEGMLARAAAKPTAAGLVAGDAHALPILAARADVVLFSFVLHRLVDPAVALAEARRVVRPGGCVGIVSWGPGHGRPDQLGRVDNRASVDTPDRLRALLADAGFDKPDAWLDGVVYAVGVASD